MMGISLLSDAVLARYLPPGRAGARRNGWTKNLFSPASIFYWRKANEMALIMDARVTTVFAELRCYERGVWKQ